MKKISKWLKCHSKSSILKLFLVIFFISSIYYASLPFALDFMWKDRTVNSSTQVLSKPVFIGLRPIARVPALEKAMINWGQLVNGTGQSFYFYMYDYTGRVPMLRVYEETDGYSAATTPTGNSHKPYLTE
ncbi:hypothetical protein [Thalassoglobus sp.]|uniref:hypothetical protein n=1 Tax=Thalassoglobus sp. TaxID=2795869 RepID=UPI003AA96038